MDTLLLDATTWDLCTDAAGNIAMASNPYALAQDAASAIRTFAGEVYYDTRQGVPYFSAILGKAPPIAFIKARFAAAAMTVPEVVQAASFIAGIKDRVVTGQVQIRDAAGFTAVAGF